MRITIDTREDSKEEIIKVIELLKYSVDHDFVKDKVDLFPVSGDHKKNNKMPDPVASNQTQTQTQTQNQKLTEEHHDLGISQIMPEKNRETRKKEVQREEKEVFTITPY